MSFLLSAKNDIFITELKKGEKWLKIKSKENKAWSDSGTFEI